jgi:hypothetical protein
VVGGALGVEAENVGPAADPGGRVRQVAEQRPDRLGVEEAAQL